MRLTLAKLFSMSSSWHVLKAAVVCALFAVSCFSVTTTTSPLEVVYPFRYSLPYAPAWFGRIVLPPDRVQAKVTYGGDACESLLGRTPVRNTLVLVDRGRCSFIQKVSKRKIRAVLFAPRPSFESEDPVCCDF